MYASNSALVTPPTVIRLRPIPAVVSEPIVVVLGGVLRGRLATTRCPRGASIAPCQVEIAAKLINYDDISSIDVLLVNSEASALPQVTFAGYK